MFKPKFIPLVLNRKPSKLIQTKPRTFPCEYEVFEEQILDDMRRELLTEYVMKKQNAVPT